MTSHSPAGQVRKAYGEHTRPRCTARRLPGAVHPTVRRELDPADGGFVRKVVFGGHSEPRCGNVPLTRTPNTTRGDCA